MTTINSEAVERFECHRCLSKGALRPGSWCLNCAREVAVRSSSNPSARQVLDEFAALTAPTPADDVVELIRARAKQRPSSGLIERQGLDETAIKYGQALLLALADEVDALLNQEPSK